MSCRKIAFLTLFPLLIIVRGQWYIQNPVPHGLTINGILALDSVTAITAAGSVIARTLDAGRTWSVAYLRDVSYGARIAGAGGRSAWIAGAFDSSYFTEDAGGHWTQRKIRAGVRLSDMVFVNERRGFAFGYANFGPGYPRRGVLCRTVDGGASWDTTVIDTSSYGGFDRIFFTDSLHGWAAGNNYIFARTTDGGKTWIRSLVASLNDDNNMRDIRDFRFFDASRGVAITSGRVFITADGGQSWKVAHNEGTATPRCLLAVDYHSPDTIVIAGTASTIPPTAFAVYSCGNATAWCGAGFSTVDGYSAMCAVSSAQHITWLAGGNGMVVRTRNMANFEIVNQGVPQDLNDLDLCDERHGWTVGNNGTILCTHDGATWNRQICDSAVGNLLSVCFSDTLSGWVGGENGWMYSTSDGGVSWRRLPSSISSDFVQIVFVDKAHGWALTEYAYGILRTTDGGQTWRGVEPGILGRIGRIRFIDSATGFAAGENGAFFRTADGGATWTTIAANDPSGATRSVFDFRFFGPDTGWAVCGDGVISKTVDGGVTWRPVSAPYGQYSRIAFSDGSRGWAADGYRVCVTDDGGEHWSTFVMPSGTSGIRCIDAAAGAGCMVAGASGLIAGPGKPATLSVEGFSGRTAARAGQPEPEFAAIHHDRITFRLNSDGVVRGIVVTAAGRLVYSWQSQTRSGTSLTVYSPRRIPAGLCIIIIDTRNGRRIFPVCAAR